MTLLTTVKTLLGVSDQDDVLNAIIELNTKALLNRIGVKPPSAKEYIVAPALPSELEYIIVETTVSRFNRLGSEGLQSEGIDVIKQTFTEDIFSPYEKDIHEYKKNTFRIKVI